MILLSMSFVFPIFHFKLDRVLFHVIPPYLKYSIFLCHFVSRNGRKQVTSYSGSSKYNTRQIICSVTSEPKPHAMRTYKGTH